jgi:hypothetical protein
LYKFFVASVLANEQPKIILHGAGGCGKSHFIRAVVSSLRTANCPVAIAAPTGCAAFLIRGSTLHSCLALPVSNGSYGRAKDAPLPSGALLQNLRNLWRRVRLLVVDEISMISDETIRMIDERLQLYRGRPGRQKINSPARPSLGAGPRLESDRGCARERASRDRSRAGPRSAQNRRAIRRARAAFCGRLVPIAASRRRAAIRRRGVEIAQ